MKRSMTSLLVLRTICCAVLKKHWIPFKKQMSMSIYVDKADSVASSYFYVLLQIRNASLTPSAQSG